MTKTQDIQAITDRYVNENGLFLVTLKISPDNVMEIVLDGPKGVTLDQCIALSNVINNTFDREVEDYELTVSSAGLEPFKVFQQYVKYLGKEVEIIFKSGNKRKATLTAATPDSISIQYEELQKVEGKKRKQPIPITETHLLTDIKSTKPIIKWKD